MCVINRLPRITYLLSISSQTYVEKSKAPLLINSCEFDERFPPSLAETADGKFASFTPGYRRTYSEGVNHGFASRGDLVRPRAFFFGHPELIQYARAKNNATVKAAKEGAFQASVEWLIKHL